jgi:exosortase
MARQLRIQYPGAIYHVTSRGGPQGVRISLRGIGLRCNLCQMHAVENAEAESFGSFGQEVRFYWAKLPDRVIFLGLLAAWCLLFQFFGWTSAIVGLSDSLFGWMWDKWSDPSNDASHGKLIPWVVLGLLWLRRRRLVDSMTGVWWPGLAGLALALWLHIVGVMVQQPRLSMVALFSGAWVLTGLVWGRETLKVSFFPFFIFAFCVPMGGTFAQGLTLPLRLLAAKGALFVSKDLLDISVVRNGTKLLDPNHVYTFDVAAECSGIRGFTALLAITMIFSVLTKRTLWRRAVMIAATVPLALFCNVMRITTNILAASAFKSQAAGAFMDEWFGYVTYGVAIGGMLLLGRLLREKPLAVPP